MIPALMTALAGFVLMIFGIAWALLEAYFNFRERKRPTLGRGGIVMAAIGAVLVALGTAYELSN